MTRLPMTGCLATARRYLGRGWQPGLLRLTQPPTHTSLGKKKKFINAHTHTHLRNVCVGGGGGFVRYTLHFGQKVPVDLQPPSITIPQPSVSLQPPSVADLRRQGTLTRRHSTSPSGELKEDIEHSGRRRRGGWPRWSPGALLDATKTGSVRRDRWARGRIVPIPRTLQTPRARHGLCGPAMRRPQRRPRGSLTVVESR